MPPRRGTPEASLPLAVVLRRYSVCEGLVEPKLPPERAEHAPVRVFDAPGLSGERGVEGFVSCPRRRRVSSYALVCPIHAPRRPSVVLEWDPLPPVFRRRAVFFSRSLRAKVWSLDLLTPPRRSKPVAVSSTPSRRLFRERNAPVCEV